LRWSDDVSGARPRHVRLRVVSRFSALQKACQNIEMAANAGVFRFCIGVVRPCGSCPAPARFLPDGRAVPASRPNGSCLAAKRFLPGRTVPAKRFLPGRSGSCAAPARFLPGSCPVPATAETVPAKRRFEIENCKFPIQHYQLAADSSHDSPRTGCSPFPRPRRWALALRPEHHPRSDQSGHVEQPACRTRCPKEPHAQRSWHLQRSLPAQSEDLRTEVWLAESLRRRGARRGASDCVTLDETAPQTLIVASLLITV